MARSSDLPFPLSLLRDRSFQAREIRRVIALSTLYLAITTMLAGLFHAALLDSLLDGVAPLLFVSEDAALAADAVPALGEVLGRWLLAMLAVNVVVTVVLGIFITRRLGQPILAIKRALREIGAGNLDVRLRASDSRDFGEIATELTEAMRTVRAQVAAAKSGIEQATTPMTAPDASADAGAGTAADAGAGVLANAAAGAPTGSPDAEHRARALADCRKALDWFQVDGDIVVDPRTA